MTKTRLILAGVAVAMLAVLGFMFGRSPVANGSADRTPDSREDAVLVSREVGGNTAVSVTVRRVGDELLLQPGIGPDLSGFRGKVLTFAFALDTHDGDIANVDLNGKIFIRDSAGVEIPGMARQLSTSTHHTTYAAAFPKLDSRGTPLDAPENKKLTIIIKDVGALKERVLEWNLQK